MQTAQVKDHFRAQAVSYADLMTRLIPFYSVQRDVMVALMTAPHDVPLRVLDLGCGPGLIAERVLTEFPRAELTLFDLTPEMINAARLRLHDDARVTYRIGDFRCDDIGSSYDVILASLSLHHLEVPERQEFAQRLCRSLTAAGQLITSEVIIDESLSVRERQYQAWRQFMSSQGEDGEAWYQKHLAKDHPVELSTWLGQLSTAGFASVGCFWRYLNFAVISAMKDV